MIERIEDMPDGSVGLSASGKLTKEEYVDVLEPAINEAVDSGEARIVFVLTDFDGIKAAAVPEDVKTGFKAEFAHRKEWKRFALVTDEDWVAKAMRMFAWLMPGELMIYGMDQLDEAKSWVAG